MVLSNAERQARYRQKLKEAAIAATVPVTVRIGSSLSNSEPVASPLLAILPRVGETVSVGNYSLKVKDVIHHPMDGVEAHTVTIVVTKGNAAKDEEIIAKVRGF